MLARILVVLNLILFVGLAIASLIQVDAVLAQIGLAALSGSGLIEFQVILAGTFLGLALLLTGAAVSGRSLTRVLSGLLILYTTWLGTRLIALTMTPPDQPATLVFLLFEGVMIVLLLLASYLDKRSRQRSIFSRNL